MKKENLQEQMTKIHIEIEELSTSPLFSYRKENNYLPVIGEGSLESKIMLIGEAPGKNEALTGKPFCGRAGQILDNVLESIDLPRTEIYITNIIKDRPPENRDPSPEEIELYAPFLDRQIEIIKPEIIATLGRLSMASIMKRYGLEDKIETIGKIHGQIFEGVSPNGFKFKLIPLHHPAATIYNKESRKNLFEDAKKIVKELRTKN